MFDFLGNGLGPIADGSPGGGGMVSFPGEIYQTPALDLTVPTLGIEFIPAKPGHFPVVGLAFWIILSKNGTQTVPVQFTAGNNPAHSNFMLQTASPSNVDVSNVVVPPAYAAGIGSGIAQGLQMATNAPVILDITAGAQGTGSFALRGRLFVATFWQSVLGS